MPGIESLRRFGRKVFKIGEDTDNGTEVVSEDADNGIEVIGEDVGSTSEEFMRLRETDSKEPLYESRRFFKKLDSKEQGKIRDIFVDNDMRGLRGLFTNHSDVAIMRFAIAVEATNPTPKGEKPYIDRVDELIPSSI
jgi:hypothetical protein